MPPKLFPVSPADFATSELFERTFGEGMDLVEETAAYLEGTGRDTAKALSRAGALAYAAESMALTTRLMQVASWLLVHRAVRDGEISCAEAREDRYRLKPGETASRMRSIEGRGELPAKLLDLLARSERLYERVARLDERLFGRAAPPADANPVGKALARLETAIKTRGPG